MLLGSFMPTRRKGIVNLGPLFPSTLSSDPPGSMPIEFGLLIVGLLLCEDLWWMQRSGILFSGIVRLLQGSIPAELFLHS